jgi:hypothetical protein
MYTALRRAARLSLPAAVGAGYLLKARADAAPASPALPAPEVDVEVTPTELHLISAQLLFRHGHRTPVHAHHLIDHESQGWETTPALPQEAPSVAVVNANVSARAAVERRGGVAACGGRLPASGA